MIISGAAVIFVVLLIILVSSMSKKSAPLVLDHAGSPDFDNYAKLVTVSNLDVHEGLRMNRRFGRILCTVANESDRVIVGLQMRAFAIGMSNELLMEKLVSVVPTQKDTLAPGQRLRLDVNLEPIPDPTTIQDMKIEVYALKVR